MKKKLIFVLGSGGSGKTTIAKVIASQLQYALLDIGTIAKKFGAKVMEASYHDPDDKQSEFYQQQVRALEYEVLEDCFIENLAIGNNVVVCGTFSKEVKDTLWLERLINRNERILANVSIFVVWVKVDSDVKKERLLKRSASKDDWKLKHWDSYTKSTGDFSVDWRMGPFKLKVFDNNCSERTELESKIKGTIEWIITQR